VQAVQSPVSNLLVKVAPFFYNDGQSKELLCLAGTVTCQYKGSRYNIPVDIWFQQDHPHVAPLAYVKPTAEMYVSPNSQDVQPDGMVILPYLKRWRHVSDAHAFNSTDNVRVPVFRRTQPNSDMSSLLNAMSEAFSRSPPVYSGAPSRSTPYPTHPPSMGAAMPMPGNAHTTVSPYPYATSTIPQDIYRDSLQTAAFEKIRTRLNEFNQMGRAQIDSLRKTEQDLQNGEKKIDMFIQNIEQEQSQAQVRPRLVS
jgi:ESCRT-I complex subunit TSG101